MKHVVKMICTYIACLLAFTAVLLSQAQSGSVHGQITDITGAVIPGAKITVRSNGKIVANTVSDGAGSYSIHNLPPGKYTLAGEAKGFAVLKREIQITTGEDLEAKMTLPIATHKIEIVVEGQNGANDEGQGHAVGVGSESNADAMVISGKELDYLSDDPTELGSELLALAGPSAGPNGGQIYVDGFASGFLPPKISIREVRINQNPFSAEQDKLGYGRIDVYTKPGAGQIHGQIVADEYTSALNSSNPFAPEKVPYNSTIATADIWGPLGKQATGYVSFQRRNINDTTPVNVVTLDNNLNPVPFTATLPHPNRVTVAATRIDYQKSANVSMILRYMYTGVTDKNGGIVQFDLPSQAADTRTYEHRIQFSNTIRLGARAENDTRFEFKKSLDAANALDGSPEVEVTDVFTSGGNSIGNISNRQTYYELQNNTLLVRGPHVVKFGGRLRTRRMELDSTQLFAGEFQFAGLDAYRATLLGMQQGLTPAQIRAAGGGAELFTIIAGQPVTTNDAIDGALYVQDDWRIRPNLNLGYGVRFETQNFIDARPDFAPRIGVAWGIDGRKNKAPSTILRTGFGIFYDRLDPNFEVAAERIDGVRTREIIVQNPDFFPTPPSSLALSTVQRSLGLMPGPIVSREEHTGQLFLPTTTQIAQNMRAPYVMQAGLALEHQFGKRATTSVIYLHTRGVHQLLSRNINAPLPGTFDPQNPTAGTRPLGQLINVYQYQSEGSLRQNQVISSLNFRTASRITIVAKHTLNFAHSNSSSPGTFPMDQFDPTADYGRATFDIRNRFSLGSTVDLGKGFRVSPFLLAMSGTPFDIIVGPDLNGDSILNDRPAFATDLSRPSVVLTRFGAFDTQPMPGQKIIPRNFGTGPFQYTFNMRAGKTFHIGGKESGQSSPGHAKEGTWNPHYTMTFNVVAQNLFNHLNAGLPIGNLSSPLFGKSNTLAGGVFSSSSASRRISLQANVSF